MQKRDLVKSVLIDHPETRDDDMQLMIRVWERQGVIISDAFKSSVLDFGMSPDTMSRIRRKLRQDGLIKGSDAIEQARYDKFVSLTTDSSLDNLEFSL